MVRIGWGGRGLIRKFYFDGFPGGSAGHLLGDKDYFPTGKGREPLLSRHDDSKLEEKARLSRVFNLSSRRGRGSLRPVC